MSAPLIGLICVAVMLLLIAFRCPISLAMSAVGFVGFGFIVAFKPAFALLEKGPFETLTAYGFSPVPMFILLGVFASKARMSVELFNGAKTFFGGWRGGMGLAAVTSCGVFSAISGSSLATAASMARVALPEMKRTGMCHPLPPGRLLRAAPLAS